MDKGTLIRTIVLAVALINQALVTKGYDTIPVGSEEFTQFVTLGVTIGTSVWAWWKNNYVSKRGKEQREVLQEFGLTNAK